MKPLHFITFCFFILMPLNCFLQEQQFTVFNVEDGLPSSEVYDVIQDDYGYIWFSTDRGLSRYNGYEFENFDSSDGLPNNVVFDFLKRENGEIWCTTITSELFKITGRTPKFTRYKYNSIIKQEGNTLVISGLYFCPNGDLLVHFHHRFGYLRISSKGEIKESPSVIADDNKFYYSMVLKDDQSEPFFFNIKKHPKNYPNSDGIYFSGRASSKNEALYFERQSVGVHIGKNNIILTHNERKDSIEIKGKLAIASGKLQDSLFWVGYSGHGVEIYNYNGQLIYHYFKDESISQVYIDDQNNTWISSLHSGVFLLKKTGIKTINIPNSPGKRVHSITHDQNVVYAGFYNGSIYKIGKNLNAEPILTPDVSMPAVVFHSSKAQTTFFNSNHTLFSTHSDFITNTTTKFIYYLNQNIYIGNVGTIQILPDNQQKQIFNNHRLKDLVFYNKRLYGASIHGLVWKQANSRGNSREGTLLKNKRIDALGILSNKLVAASSGHGIFILDEKHNMLSHITRKNGLNSNFISNIYVENDTTLWVCTNRGINRITFNSNFKYQISSLDNSDGLSSNETWDLTVLNDTVWVGTQNGINYFPKRLITVNGNRTSDFYLHLNNVLVHGIRQKRLGRELHLDYNENKIEFQFEGICFQKRLNYRYKLVGLDGKWSYTKHRSIIFPSLPPGNYKFVLQARTRDGEWSANETQLSFVIHPPFWDSWWFILCLIAAIVLVVYLFFKYRILSYNREILREILRQLLKRLKRREPPHIIIRDQGKEVKIPTSTVLFVKSSGNYLEIVTENKIHVTRLKIGEFLDIVPDPIEFLRIHRSYIIRLDQVQQKSSRSVVIIDQEIPVGRKYWGEIDNITL